MELLIESERSELQQHERTIEQGLKTFVDVGNALLAIRDKRLYRQGFGTFEDYCNQRWNMERNYANKLIASAEVIQNLGTVVPILPTSERQARPLTKLEPEMQPVVWQKAVETAPNGKVTAAHVEATVKTFVAPKQPTPVASYEDDRSYNSTAPVQATPVKSFVAPAPVKLTPTPAVEVLRPVVVEKPVPIVVEKPVNGQPVNSMAVHFSSDSPEHYTPREIIDAAIAVMGGIDLDPCSNSKTAPNVPALDHFTIADDGLSLPWFGRIYMNPPYGRVIGDWVTKLVSEYKAGNVTEAIALVPARTDTQWIAALDPFHCCYIRGRLTFIGNNDPAPFPSVVYYLGQNTTQFFGVFRDFGSIKVELDEHWFTD